MPMCPDVNVSAKTLNYGLMDCWNMRVFFFTHTHRSVRNHFTQGNEPVPDLCRYKEQIPFYQNENYNEGRKL